jgi:hypothetical protein
LRFVERAPDDGYAGILELLELDGDRIDVADEEVVLR